MVNEDIKWLLYLLPFVLNVVKPLFCENVFVCVTMLNQLFIKNTGIYQSEG